MREIIPCLAAVIDRSRACHTFLTAYAPSVLRRFDFRRLSQINHKQHALQVTALEVVKESKTVKQKTPKGAFCL
jgi:hypothetical protein